MSDIFNRCLDYTGEVAPGSDVTDNPQMLSRMAISAQWIGARRIGY
jgi:hypothetical protein